jgi:hypothetical protein
MSKCAGIKPDGGRCAVDVAPGETHCYGHDPDRADERRRNAARGGRAKGMKEIQDLKKKLKELAADVLEGKVDRGKGAVANQVYGTLLRAVELERKVKETEELEARIEALERTSGSSAGGGRRWGT